MDASPIQLGAEIRQLRHQLGLTQRQVAERLAGHIVERDIQRLESGYTGTISPRDLEALLRVLNNDLQSFFSSRPVMAAQVSAVPTAGDSTIVSVPWSRDSKLPDLTQARHRLQLAMQSSEAACQRAKELLHAKDSLAGQWIPRSNLDVPSSHSRTSAP